MRIAHAYCQRVIANDSGIYGGKDEKNLLFCHIIHNNSVFNVKMVTLVVFISCFYIQIYKEMGFLKKTSRFFSPVPELIKEVSRL